MTRFKATSTLMDDVGVCAVVGIDVWRSGAGRGSGGVGAPATGGRDAGPGRGIREPVTTTSSMSTMIVALDEPPCLSVTVSVTRVLPTSADVQLTCGSVSAESVPPAADQRNVSASPSGSVASPVRWMLPPGVAKHGPQKMLTVGDRFAWVAAGGDVACGGEGGTGSGRTVGVDAAGGGGGGGDGAAACFTAQPDSQTLSKSAISAAVACAERPTSDLRLAVKGDARVPLPCRIMPPLAADRPPEFREIVAARTSGPRFQKADSPPCRCG